MPKLRICSPFSWKEFFLEDIVCIRNGTRLTKSEMQPGITPFIGASELKNGITCFTSSNNKSIAKNVLGVNYNGSVGHSFYHPYQALFSDDVKIVYWKDVNKNNKYTLLYLSTMIKMQKDKYAYGYKFNSQRMKRQKILLPINSQGIIDWHFMETFMKQKERQILKPTLEKLCKHLIENEIGGGNYSNCSWKEFVFGEEFVIEATHSGIDKNKLNIGSGRIPYITRTDKDNGIDACVPLQKAKYKTDGGNVITIGLDTQTVFYQPSSFYTGQNIQIVSHPRLDRYNAMFIIVAIKKLVEKFSWGSYGATLTRLKKGKLFLPATKEGDIDFDFMSEFMQNIEEGLLSNTLKYFRQRVNDCKFEMGGGKMENI